MEIEFDSDKDAINLKRHGVSLAFGAQVFLDVGHIVIPSIRPIDGEDRFKVVGLVDGKLYTGVHVLRGKRSGSFQYGGRMMANKETMIAIKADPNDPEDFDVSVAALERALAERRERLRGPQKAPTKELVSIRLDRDLVARFRAGGAGWQSRVNDTLRKAVGLS